MIKKLDIPPVVTGYIRLGLRSTRKVFQTRAGTEAAGVNWEFFCSYMQKQIVRESVLI